MIEQLLTLLSILGVAAKQRSSNTKDLVAVADVLGIIRETIEAGQLTSARLQQLTNTIQAMVDENRDPTAEEWEILRMRSNSAHSIIQNFNTDDDTAGAVLPLASTQPPPDDSSGSNTPPPAA
jgi:type II secretory pathway pseudopilin PulG